MNMDMVTALGLLGKLTQSSVTVNTASRQNMGVAGDVKVNFKIGRKYLFTHRFVVCENLTDNGTEFKNDLFNTVVKQLGVERRSTHHHTDLNQMVTLRDFIIS